MHKVSPLFIKNWLAKFEITLNVTLDEAERFLVNDSRQIKAHDIFCAINGHNQHGADFVDDALAKGCDLILLECDLASQHGNTQTRQNYAGHSVEVVSFYQLNRQLFALAKAFYQAPQDSLNIIGITGTNGKTSTSQILARLLQLHGENAAVIGTNGAGNIDHICPINNTTPGATELHQLMWQFKEQGDKHVVMEVSSHALAQGRVHSELFDIAMFTNLTRDHLDYHQTMENYAAAKFQIFSQQTQQLAVVNGDDNQAQAWLPRLDNKQSVVVYGFSPQISKASAFVQATEINLHAKGCDFLLRTHVGDIRVSSRLLGQFNIANLLGAIAVLVSRAVPLSTIAELVSKLSPIAGRMETYGGNGKVTAVVDYAHTPDALDNALVACRQHCKGALWVVFGCGGDRDTGKRALMGEVAEQHADHIVITNDNPRSEAPENIANEILSGCIHQEKINIVLERQEAVLFALNNAAAHDVVLLAGKGHENYIEMQGKRINYDERELVSSYFAQEARL